MTRWLDADQQRAWRTWIDVNAKLAARLNRELQASDNLSLSDYHVLVALTDVSDHTLRMYELGEIVGWEKSRLSKQISRMVARGLVERTECPEDRRGADVALTESGLAAIRSAAPGHVDLVRELFFADLGPEEVRQLGDYLAKVRDRVDG
jgi:DNA-binding MarR family transcriptional regulator